MTLSSELGSLQRHLDLEAGVHREGDVRQEETHRQCEHTVDTGVCSHRPAWKARSLQRWGGARKDPPLELSDVPVSCFISFTLALLQPPLRSLVGACPTRHAPRVRPGERSPGD